MTGNFGPVPCSSPRAMGYWIKCKFSVNLSKPHRYNSHFSKDCGVKPKTHCINLEIVRNLATISFCDFLVSH